MIIPIKEDRICHKYGVPALAGQIGFRHGSRNVSTRSLSATSRRLMPGLHTLRTPTLAVAPIACSFQRRAEPR